MLSTKLYTKHMHATMKRVFIFIKYYRINRPRFFKCISKDIEQTSKILKIHNNILVNKTTSYISAKEWRPLYKLS